MWGGGGGGLSGGQLGCVVTSCISPSSQWEMRSNRGDIKVTIDCSCYYGLSALASSLTLISLGLWIFICLHQRVHVSVCACRAGNSSLPLLLCPRSTPPAFSVFRQVQRGRGCSQVRANPSPWMWMRRRTWVSSPSLSLPLFFLHPGPSI